jgi:hypothetical protein
MYKQKIKPRQEAGLLAIIGDEVRFISANFMRKRKIQQQKHCLLSKKRSYAFKNQAIFFIRKFCCY